MQIGRKQNGDKFIVDKRELESYKLKYFWYVTPANESGKGFYLKFNFYYA
jgi:hypothetical protein